MLELREPESASRTIEEWLRERGLSAPGGEDLAADLHLGYGLSQTIRRETAPLPPEPCPALSLAACRIGRGREDLVAQSHEAAQAGERIARGRTGVGRDNLVAQSHEDFEIGE